jgi:hypothetical protein
VALLYIQSATFTTHISSFVSRLSPPEHQSSNPPSSQIACRSYRTTFLTKYLPLSINMAVPDV